MSLISPLSVDEVGFEFVGLTDEVIKQADHVILSTAVSRNSAWILPANFFSLLGLVESIRGFIEWIQRNPQTSFRAMKLGARLTWWVHESGAIMNAMGPNVISSALRAMSSGRVHSIIFVSLAAQAWWKARGITSKTSTEEGLTRRRGQINSIYPFFSPATQHELHWGVPRWKLNHLSSKAHNKTSVKEETRILRR